MKRNRTTIIISLLVIGLLIGGSLIFKAPHAVLSTYDCSSKVCVTSDTLNVRSGVGTKCPITGVLNKGDAVNVLGKLDNWYIIYTNNNIFGAISSKYTTSCNQGTTSSRPASKPETAPAQEPKPAPAPAQEPKPAPAPAQEPKPASNPESTPAPQPSSGLSSEQSRMLQLVNEERAKAGVKALEWDSALANVANIKAQDMVDKGYFDHNSPTYGSPFDMMKKFGIKYYAAGENLAGYNNVEKAHVGLMNSDGHRKNILNSNFTHIGIGVAKSPKYGYVFVQMFIGK